MPRSGSSPALGSRHARTARGLRRFAIVSIGLGCLLGMSAGAVLAQGAGSSGSQAVGSAGAIQVAGADEQVVACRITVPPHALTAQGLATPWVLSGDRGGQCAETNPDQAAFIDATIFDPATGRVLIYRPLVITEGTTAAADPVPPKLPAGAVVEISVGFNGDELTLTDSHGGQDIAESHCVNGQPGSIFGQEIFCNAPAFYAAANGKVAFDPPLGTSPDDGRTCPTTESWEIVDQDQSDNTTTNYLVRDGQTAQSTAANQQALGNDQIGNGSDNALYTKFYAPAIGCQPPRATDVTDPDAPVRSTSSALLNLFARSANDPDPALVPMGDPFTLVDGTPSLEKTNLYRAQVNQPPAANAQDASVATYCRKLLDLGLTKIELDRQFLRALGSSPDPAVSDDLHLFVLNRFKESWDNLGCQDQTGIRNPVAITTGADGRVLSAQVALPTTTTDAPATSEAPTTTMAPGTTAAPSSTAAPTTTAAEPTTTLEPSTTVPPTTAANLAGPPSTGGSPPTTQPPATVPGLAERHRPATSQPGAPAALARTGIGTGLLPFTGIDSRALLLASATLLGLGGWLLLCAGRARRGHPIR